jgi:hypothetical protein
MFAQEELRNPGLWLSAKEELGNPGRWLSAEEELRNPGLKQVVALTLSRETLGVVAFLLVVTIFNIQSESRIS